MFMLLHSTGPCFPFAKFNTLGCKFEGLQILQTHGAPEVLLLSKGRRGMSHVSGVPTREGIHNPPWEKENHRLKSARQWLIYGHFLFFVACISPWILTKICLLISGWWFQPIWKIIVKLEIFPKQGVKIKDLWNPHHVYYSTHLINIYICRVFSQLIGTRSSLNFCELNLAWYTVKYLHLDWFWRFLVHQQGFEMARILSK